MVLLGNSAHGIRPDNEEQDDDAVQSRNQNPNRKCGGRGDAEGIGLRSGEADKDSSSEEPGQDQDLGDQLHDRQLFSITGVQGPQEKLLDRKPRKLVEDGGNDGANLAGSGRRRGVEKDGYEIDLSPQGRTEKEKNEDQPLAVPEGRGEAIAPEVENEGRGCRVQHDSAASTC